MRVRWFSSSRSCPVVNGEFIHAWTSCSRLLFGKLIVRQVLERLPAVLWKPLCSSPCSQEPATFRCTLSEVNTVHDLPSGFYNMSFNTSVPTTPVSSKWSVSLRFSHQNSAWNSPLSHAFNMLHPSHCLWFVTGIIFDEVYRCCLLYYSERVGRLSTLCLCSYVDPDFGDTKFVRSVGRPAYQPKHKALHSRRESRASSVLCISFCWRSVHVPCTDIDTNLNEARIS